MKATYIKDELDTKFYILICNFYNLLGSYKHFNIYSFKFLTNSKIYSCQNIFEIFIFY